MGRRERVRARLAAALERRVSDDGQLVSGVRFSGADGAGRATGLTRRFGFSRNEHAARPAAGESAGAGVPEPLYASHGGWQ